jgi:hypothetical protein
MKLIAIFLCLLAVWGCALPLWGGVDIVECFFDTDPGEGAGFQLYSRDPVEISQLVSAAGLDPGLHKLFVRARNELGQWGMPQSRNFLLPPLSSVEPHGTITHIEYFFDTDPGPGNGVQIYTRDSVDLTQLVSTSSLGIGVHRLYMRSRNDSGQWGMPASRSFFKALLPAETYTVTRLEYYLDTDPGFGNGTQISLTAGNPASVSTNLTFPGVNNGIHKLYVRGKNNQGQWGFSSSVEFSNGIPVDLVLSVVDGIITLSWTDLPGVDSYIVHSADQPQGPYLQEADGAVSDALWTHTATDPLQFFRVTSIYAEP